MDSVDILQTGSEGSIPGPGTFLKSVVMSVTGGRMSNVHMLVAYVRSAQEKCG